MRKDGCQSKTVVEQGRDTKRPSLSQYDRKISQGQNSLVHCLHSHAFLSENFGAPVIIGNKGSINSPS